MQKRRTQFYRKLLREAARTEAERGSQSEIRSIPEEKASQELKVGPLSATP